jgi:modulator of FtsH protease HflK
MAWNPRNSGGGRSTGPWGQNPQGGGRGGSGRGSGGDQPPDLEDLLKRSQDRLRRAFPPGFGGSAMIGLLVIAAAAVWLLSGIYFVSAKEEAVVLRFGKFNRLAGPGMHLHIPWPVETVYTPEVTRVFREDIGPSTSSEGTTGAGSGDDSMMLTKDRNFLIVDFTVQYRIKNARDYLFNVDDPKHAVIDVSTAAMREVVGSSDFDSLQTSERSAAEQQAKSIIQQTLDSYQAGIEVMDINIQRVDPPDRALEAARDVETARQEKDTAQNNAEAYQNKVIPEARGQAERIIQDAQAYKQQVVAEAQGETSRFDSIYEQYKKAPDVTRRRMYIETMEQILGGMNKVIIDEKGGVMPYLPLPGLKALSPSPAAVPDTTSSTAPQASATSTDGGN